MSENLNDLRPEIQDLSIQKRRGLVVISKDLLFNSQEALLKEIFSNIFPIYVDSTHRINHYDSIMYHCLSPLFEEVDMACIAPEYRLTIDFANPEEPKLIGAEKVDSPFYAYR